MAHLWPRHLSAQKAAAVVEGRTPPRTARQVLVVRQAAASELPNIQAVTVLLAWRLHAADRGAVRRVLPARAVTGQAPLAVRLTTVPRQAAQPPRQVQQAQTSCI
jgi:hypothetical protein